MTIDSSRGLGVDMGLLDGGNPDDEARKSLIGDLRKRIAEAAGVFFVSAPIVVLWSLMTSTEVKAVNLDQAFALANEKGKHTLQLAADDPLITGGDGGNGGDDPKVIKRQKSSALNVVDDKLSIGDTQAFIQLDTPERMAPEFQTDVIGFQKYLGLDEVGSVSFLDRESGGITTNLLDHMIGKLISDGYTVNVNELNVVSLEQLGNSSLRSPLNWNRSWSGSGPDVEVENGITKGAIFVIGTDSQTQQDFGVFAMGNDGKLTGIDSVNYRSQTLVNVEIVSSPDGIGVGVLLKDGSFQKLLYGSNGELTVGVPTGDGQQLEMKASNGGGAKGATISGAAAVERVTKIATPGAGEGGVTSAVETEGYLDKLDVKFLPEQNIEWNGIKLEIPVTTGATNGIRAYEGSTKVEIGANTLSKKALEMMHNIFLPNEDLTDENLRTFAETLAKIEKGELPPSTYGATFKTVDPGGLGEPREITLVPPSGGIVSVGAIEMSGLTMVYGRYPSNSGDWYKEIFPSKTGAGLMIGNEGEVFVYIGMRESTQISTGYVPMALAEGTELAIEWLRSEVQGKKYTLKMISGEQDRLARTWMNDIHVK
jgi:hypothetical protein